MKNQITFLIVLLFLVFIQAFGQAPQAFKYQTIARDNSGNIIANKLVSFRMSLLQGSISGPVSYSEKDTATTNQFGLANLAIGSGTILSGKIDTINWGNGPYFIKIEFDPTGGNSFTLMGISKMLSVPYALYSQSTGDTSIWRKNGNTIYYNKGSVGIGIKNPANLLHLLDTISPNLYVYIEGLGGGIQLWTHDTINRPAKRWVLSNGTNSYGNCFGLENYNGYDWFLNVFVVESGSPTNSLVITPKGVGMGTATPTSTLQVVGLPVYANNAAAISGGLTVGAFYRTGADPDPVCVVH